MLCSSGGDGNKKILFLLFSLILFFSLCVFPVYGEDMNNPYVPYEISNIDIVTGENGDTVSINFLYKGKSYSIPYTEKINCKNFVFRGDKREEYLNILYIDCVEDYSVNLRYFSDIDTLNIPRYGYFTLNLDTLEISYNKVAGTYHLKSPTYEKSNNFYFISSNCNISSSSGGYFFQLPPPPPPTILEGVSLEGVLTQVIYLLPSCLLWIVAYLSLRKCLTLLLALLKTS